VLYGGYPVVHFELPVDDPARATRFYQEALGWQITKWEGPMPYWTVETDAAPPNAALGGGLSLRQGPEHVTELTVAVDDIMVAVSKVIAAGGAVEMEPTLMPGVDTLAQCLDTEGNIFGLLQPSEG